MMGYRNPAGISTICGEMSRLELFVGMGRGGRLLVGALLPVILADFILSMALQLDSMIGVEASEIASPPVAFPEILFVQLKIMVGGVLVMLPWGYATFGLQSIIYSFLMEFIVNPGFRRDFPVVVASGFLGLFSVAIVTESRSISVFEFMHAISVAGLGAGLVTGIVLRKLYQKGRNEHAKANG